MPDTAGTSNTKTEGTRSTVVNGLVAIVLVVVLLIAFGDTGIRAESFVPLDDLEVTADVTYVNGETAHFETGDFGTLAKGDRADLHITLPAIPQGTEAYFPLFNSFVDMYVEGEALYHDSYDPDNRAAHYGNRIYEAPLRSEFAGRTLTVRIVANQTTGYSELDESGLVQANEGWKRILENRTSVFVVFLSLISLALSGALYCAVLSIIRRRLLIGLPIALFELFLIAWFFGTHHMFHLLFGGVEFCAKVEYYALYLVPLPLGLFIYMVVDSPKFKRAVGIVTLAYLVFYVITTAIELSPVQLNYSDMISAMHPIAGVLFVVLATSLFFGVEHDRQGHIFILRYGTLLAVTCGMCELIRYALIKHTEWDSLLALNGLSVFAILTIMSFTVAVALYLIARTRTEFASRIERAQLAELAYKDILTNLPNRAGLRRRVDAMKEDGVRDYTMLFIDLNDLKIANDQYGHETGDRLLARLADVLRETFDEDGFSARYGGDEFVACVFGDKERGMRLLADFQGRIDAINERGEFPFETSVACGIASSSDDDYIDPIEAIHIADSFMYENKKDAKAAATGISGSK